MSLWRRLSTSAPKAWAFATGRVFGQSHSTVMRWEQRLAKQCAKWSPPAPVGADVTLEGDEVYTRVGENLPPAMSQGGQFTLLSAKAAIGWQPKLEKRKPNCLSREPKLPGIGRNRHNLFAGLLMGNVAMVKRCGNLLAFTSNGGRLLRITPTAKSGERG